MTPRTTSTVLLVATLLSGCVGGAERAATAVAVPPPAPPPKAASTVAGPVLGPDGRCDGPPPGTATMIEVGIAECDLVGLKGRAPTDVLVGESGKGSREVQVLYSEPTGREIYLFVDNRLTRIIR